MDLFGDLKWRRSLRTFWYVSDICFHPMFLTIFLRPILLGLIFQLLIKPRVWDMNQGRFPIIFDQIMWTRKSSGKFLPRALCLITQEGDVKTHGHNHHLTPVVAFIYLPPMCKLNFGLWTCNPLLKKWNKRHFKMASFFIWARHPTTISGFPTKITWPPSAILNEPAILFSQLVRGFPPKTCDLRISTHFLFLMTSLPVPVTWLPVTWFPVLFTSGFGMWFQLPFTSGFVMWHLSTNHNPPFTPLNQSDFPPKRDQIPYVSVHYYSDDLVILSRSKIGLQNCLNMLSSYCNSWMWSINPKKTSYDLPKTRKKMYWV